MRTFLYDRVCRIVVFSTAFSDRLSGYYSPTFLLSYDNLQDILLDLYFGIAAFLSVLFLHSQRFGAVIG